MIRMTWMTKTFSIRSPFSTKLTHTLTNHPEKKSPFLSTQKTRRTKRLFSFLLKKRSVTCPFYVIRRNHPPTRIYFICRFWCWLWCYITYNDLLVQLCYTRNSTALTLTTKQFFFSFDNFCQRDEDEDDNMRFIHSRFFTSWFYHVGKLTFCYTIAISGIFPLLFFYSPRLKITLLYRIAQIYFLYCFQLCFVIHINFPFLNKIILCRLPYCQLRKTK